VPVLLSSLQSPICDSLDITHFIANYSKSLIPENHKAEITELLAELHNLNYFSLSFPGRQQMAVTLSAPIEKRLQDPNITGEYRKALEFKIGV
jgi:glutaredoxin 2